MSKVILASLSPRRYELLKSLNINFTVESAQIEEVLNKDLSLDERLMDLAYQKARPISLQHETDIVIGADTVVVFEDEVLGKPKNRQDAYNMLKSFSGKQQFVCTAVCIICGSKVVKFIEKTTVNFKVLSDDEIHNYLDQGEYIDKAGSYEIQGKGYSLIESFEGDFNNVVGLPITRLKNILKNEFNI